MSFWWSKKEKDGKRSIYAIDVPFQLIIMFLGLVLALFAPALIGRQLPTRTLNADGFYILAGGFLLLFISKLSLLKKGIWTSWGPKPMSRSYKFFYLLGYGLMVLGVIRILT